MSRQVHMIGSAELKVIQATLRVDEARDTALRTAVQASLDWQKVLHLAKQHGVMPLVYTRLRDVASALVPSDVMREMSTWQKTHELRVLQMTVDLIKVVRALEAENIPVLCLKGPVLATLAYGDPALRHFSDLDILVHQRDYAHAEEVLRGVGSAPIHLNRTLEVDRHNNFVVGHSYLEMHWRVTMNEFPRALETEGLFARSRTVTLNGQTLHTLGAEDQIIHACQHGTQHYWAKLRYLADYVSALSTASGCGALLAAAHAQGLYRPFLISAGVCRHLLGFTLPDEIQRAISRNMYVRCIIQYTNSYLDRIYRKGPDVFDFPLFNVLYAEKHRFAGVARLLADTFTPTATDFQWIALPDGLRWLYPCLRPLRRIGRGLAVLCTRIR